jgi:hypothetical protein
LHPGDKQVFCGSVSREHILDVYEFLQNDPSLQKFSHPTDFLKIVSFAEDPDATTGRPLKEHAGILASRDDHRFVV